MCVGWGPDYRAAQAGNTVSDHEILKRRDFRKWYIYLWFASFILFDATGFMLCGCVKHCESQSEPMKSTLVVTLFMVSKASVPGLWGLSSQWGKVLFGSLSAPRLAEELNSLESVPHCSPFPRLFRDSQGSLSGQMFCAWELNTLFLKHLHPDLLTG